jgi:hypothetical protein
VLADRQANKQKNRWVSKLNKTPQIEKRKDMQLY